MHADRRHRRERYRERCRVVDLIKINTVRQESNRRRRREQKHRGVALMGSIDRASVQGQRLCPWWPIPHWLEDSHQESSCHCLSHSLTCLWFPLLPSPARSAHSAFSGSFKNVVPCNSPYYSPLHSLSAVFPLSHWLISSPFRASILTVFHLPDKTALAEYSVPCCLKCQKMLTTVWQHFNEALHWHKQPIQTGALNNQLLRCHKAAHYDHNPEGRRCSIAAYSISLQTHLTLSLLISYQHILLSRRLTFPFQHVVFCNL